MPELALVVKILTQWAPSHTAVRSRARVRQPDQSSVSLLSRCSALLWVTEASAASQIPNDGGCSWDATTWLILCRVFYVLCFSPLFLSSPSANCHAISRPPFELAVAARAEKKNHELKDWVACFCILSSAGLFYFFPFVCCPPPPPHSLPPSHNCFLSLPCGRWV